MTRWCSRIAIVSLAVAALAACKKEGELPPGFGPRGPAVDVSKLQAPALFAHIPADTPYVLASFEAVPLEYYAKMKQVMGPAFTRALEQLRAIGGSGVRAESEATRWFDAITEELDGKWTAQGLESLGLSAQPRFAIYGHGVLPVVARIEIKDGKALLATLERIASRAGAQLPALETRHNGEFWRIELPDDMGAIIAIADQQLVAAFGPRHAIAAVLPQIVGAEKPPRNMAGGEELKQVISKHRLGPVMVGFVDTRRLSSALIAHAERTPSAECTAELDRLTAQVPRLAFGYTELTGQRFSGAAAVELARPLVDELKALRTSVPGLGAALRGDPLLAFGGGLDLARGKAAGKAAAAVLRDLGRACDADELVRAARDLREGLSEPLPGPLAKISGGAVVIDALAFDRGGGGGGFGPTMPSEIEGYALLAVGDAKSAFQTLEDEVPPLRRLKLKANGKLHELDLDQLGIPLELPFDLHVGIGDQSIVLASGDRGKRQGEQALSATAGGKAPFLAGTIDMGKLMKLQADLDPFAVTRDLNRQMAAMFGRMTFSLDVTDAGLAVWMSGEVK